MFSEKRFFFIKIPAAVFLFILLSGGVKGNTGLQNLPAGAPAETPDTTALRTDSGFVEARLPDKAVIEEYSRNPDFNYEGSPPNKDSLTGIILYWLFRIINYLANTAAGGFILKTVVYLLLAGIAFLLLNQLLNGQLTSILRRRNPDKPLSPAVSFEEINRHNYALLYREALAAGDFKKAVRFAFLLVLRQFVEADLIQFSIEKTNQDYLDELGPGPLADYFRKMVTYFEYSEFGNFSVSDEHAAETDRLLSKIQDIVQ